MLKLFVSAAPGVGQSGIRSWCEAVAKSKGIEHFPLPDFCKRYREEARKIKKRIMDDDPTAVLLLKATGRYSSDEGIANALAYVHCSVWEATRINTMVQRLEGTAVIRSLECDGLYVTLEPGKTWDEVEGIMASVHPMVYKPYASVAEILEKMQLRFDTIPPACGRPTTGIGRQRATARWSSGGGFAPMRCLHWWPPILCRSSWSSMGSC